nr:uncharacterized protein LOC116432302 [Nomia melanderi]
MKNKDIAIPAVFCLMKVTGCWMANTKDGKTRSRCVKMLTVVLFFFGVYTGITDISHTLDDIDNILYMCINLAFITMGLIKFTIVCYFEDDILVYVRYAQRNFWQANYDDNEEVEMVKARNLSTFYLGITYSASFVVVSNYVLTPILSK